MAQSAKQEVQNDSEEIEAVRFQIGNKQYVINVEYIDSMEEAVDITRVPRSTDSVKGLVDIRGDIVVIIDPSTFLGVDSESVDDNVRKVILLDKTVDNQRVGFVVDTIIGVDEYDSEHFDSVSEMGEFKRDSLDEGYISSLIYTQPGTNDGRIVGLLNVDLIIEKSENEL